MPPPNPHKLPLLYNAPPSGGGIVQNDTYWPFVQCPPQARFFQYFFWGGYCIKGSCSKRLVTHAPQSRGGLSFWGGHCIEGHIITFYTMAPPLTCCPPVQNESILGEEFFLWGWYCKKGHLITFYTIPPPFTCCPPIEPRFSTKAPSLGEALSFWGGHCTKGHLITFYTIPPPIANLSPHGQNTFMGEGLLFWGWHRIKALLITFYTIPPPFSCCPPMGRLKFSTTPTSETFLFLGGAL